MGKVYSVIALLDDESTQRFLDIRRELMAVEGRYNNTLPHITISVYDKDIDLEGLVDWTRRIAESHERFKVVYTTVGIFLSSCLIAVPSFSRGLFELYQAHHQKYDECCRSYSALKNEEWMPHTGIWYTDRENALANISKLSGVFKPILAEVSSLRVTEFDHSTFLEVAEFALQDKKNR